MNILTTFSLKAQELKIETGTYLVKLKFDSGQEFIDELTIEQIIQNPEKKVGKYYDGCTYFLGGDVSYSMFGTFSSPGLFVVPIDYNCLVKSNKEERYYINFHLDEGSGIERYLLNVKVSSTQSLIESVGTLEKFTGFTYEKLGTFTLEKK